MLSDGYFNVMKSLRCAITPLFVLISHIHKSTYNIEKPIFVYICSTHESKRTMLFYVKTDAGLNILICNYILLP
jgi:hypothetical protein